MTSKVVAFDYNGTLNTEDGLRYYKQQKSRSNTVVGILTANLVLNAKRFTDKEDITPDFIRRGFLKAPQLKLIEYQVGSQHLYVGNSLNDKIAAHIAGWVYIDVSDL